jgi:TolB-like protein
MTGQTISYYRILEKLGAGGMGEVYRATDTKLGRDVALKVLRPDVALDPERIERFRREARALAAINHPHIVTIYSVEETDGVHFFTMELVQGRSLDHCIPEGGLPLDLLARIAIALADALAAAHEKGIVHRDLKPANVMLTSEGQVKVLDFGLAKEMRTTSSDETTMTSTGRTEAGVVMGTPSYMSPEQIVGRTIDHRTDIFSLGIILYEMATGQRPFQGRSSVELASAILRDAPPLVTGLRADLPNGLARIIRRCLEKDAADRFPSAPELREELRGMTYRAPSNETARVAASRPEAKVESGAARAEEGFWVAVLPFKYSGGNADLANLAEGVAEDIVTGFSRFSYLRVIARSSTLRYAREEIDVRAAGNELGARYVMEGSIRQAGSRLRIAVQLIDAITGAHLWAETYDRPFRPEAAFELQDDVIPRIVSTVADMNGILPHSMGEALRGRNSDDLSPYEALLRSFSYYARLTAEEHAAARAGLERALQQAPDHADCWAMLSMLYTDEYKTGFNVRPDSLKRGLDAARRAVELAPSNHLAHHALASVLYFRRDLQAFRSAAERAIALNTLDGCTTAYLGMLTAYSGDWERGCALAERAMQLNSHHPGWYWFASAFDGYRKNDYRGALDVALKINMRGLWGANILFAAAYGQLGNGDAARDAVRELLALSPNFAVVARDELGKWWDAPLVEHLLDGLRKAGLEIAAGGRTPAPSPIAWRHQRT